MVWGWGAHRTCAIGSVIHYIGLDFLNYTIGMGLVIRIFFYWRDETLDRDIRDQNFEFSHNQTTIKRKDVIKTRFFT